MEEFRGELHSIVQANRPCTVRQVYYLAVSSLIVEKSEKSYKRIVDVLAQMRESRELPFVWITDNTRWRRMDETFGDYRDALERIAEFYRRDLWETQPVTCEVWVESDSIAGVLDSTTRSLGCGLYFCRGQAPKTLAYSAAQEYVALAKPVSILYVGDHDPSGRAIARSLEERLRRYAPDVDIAFRQLAVTPQQIDELALVGHASKRSDVNFPGYEEWCDQHGLNEGLAWEVEAIAPPTLRGLVHEAIVGHIDVRQWRLLQEVERQERDLLTRMAGDAA